MLQRTTWGQRDGIAAITEINNLILGLEMFKYKAEAGIETIDQVIYDMLDNDVIEETKNIDPFDKWRFDFLMSLKTHLLEVHK